MLGHFSIKFHIATLTRTSLEERWITILFIEYVQSTECSEHVCIKDARVWITFSTNNEHQFTYLALIFRPQSGESVWATHLLGWVFVLVY